MVTANQQLEMLTQCQPNGGSPFTTLGQHYPSIGLTVYSPRRDEPSPNASLMLAHCLLVANPECARGGGVSNILAGKRGVSSTFFQKMHENAIFSPIRGGGRTAAPPYAGSVTVYGNDSAVKQHRLKVLFLQRVTGNSIH